MKRLPFLAALSAAWLAAAFLGAPSDDLAPAGVHAVRAGTHEAGVPVQALPESGFIFTAAVLCTRHGAHRKDLCCRFRGRWCDLDAGAAHGSAQSKLRN